MATELVTPVTRAFQEVWVRFLEVLPNIFGALIVFVLGLIVASIVELVIRKLVELIRLDVLLRKTFLEDILQRGGLRLNTGEFFGKIFFWVIAFISLFAASEVVGLTALSNFLREIIAYIPNVIAAILIVVVAIILAKFLKGLVKNSMKSAGIGGGELLGGLTWWVVVIFGLFAALTQLKIATDLIRILTIGLVGMIALAGAIAFGWAGKDYAAEILEKLKKTFEK